VEGGAREGWDRKDLCLGARGNLERKVGKRERVREVREVEVVVEEVEEVEVEGQSLRVGKEERVVIYSSQIS